MTKNVEQEKVIAATVETPKANSNWCEECKKDILVLCWNGPMGKYTCLDCLMTQFNN